MDWIFHILIPLGLLALFGIRSKWMFLLLPLTVLLDFGTLFDFRRGTHSIFVILLALAIIYTACRLSKTKDTKIIMGISAFYLFSHILLDLGGAMALLWPVVQETYNITVKIVMQGMVPELIFTINAEPIETVIGPKIGALITAAGFGLLFCFLALFIALKIIRRKNGN